jgi:hypothetical protein
MTRRITRFRLIGDHNITQVRAASAAVAVWTVAVRAGGADAPVRDFN